MSTTTARPPMLGGRTATVTGTSSRMVRATAAVLVERGARVTALARALVRLDSLAHERARVFAPVAIDLSGVGAINRPSCPDGTCTVLFYRRHSGALREYVRQLGGEP
jgi:NAD(P)-dependent dehydrogenase (short-subunit alcohol dehydrogenase family)